MYVILILLTEALESENEEILARSYSEMNADSDSDKGESRSSATDVTENEKPAVLPPAPNEPETMANKQPSLIPSLVVRDSVKPGTTGMKEKRASSNQLEELENLTSLSGKCFSNFFSYSL